MVRMDSFSSVPPHIQPPMAQVPIAIRELTRFVPSMLMYSSIFAFLPLFGECVPLEFEPGAGGLAPGESKGIAAGETPLTSVRTISFGAANECMSPKRESGPR